jgi:hypothetical protein
MILTNAERGDLIDALSTAMEAHGVTIDCHTFNGVPATAGPDLTPEDVLEMRAQIRRWRQLRRRYLAEEKASLQEFFGEKSPVDR